MLSADLGLYVCAWIGLMVLLIWPLRLVYALVCYFPMFFIPRPAMRQWAAKNFEDYYEDQLKKNQKERQRIEDMGYKYRRLFGR